MRMMRHILFSAGLGLSLVATTPAWAEKTTQVYRLAIGGLTAGQMNISADATSKKYLVRGELRGKGLVGRFLKAGYKGQARGTISGSRFIPQNFAGRLEADGKFQKVEMRYKGGTPSTLRYTPDRTKKPYDANYKAQKGTLDPVSAAFFLFRDVPKEGMCNRSFNMFDGSRRSRIVVGGPKKGRNGRTECSGTYSRVAGFSDKLMRKRKDFGFRLTYIDGDTEGMMKLDKFTVSTSFGNAVAKRIK